MEAGYNNNFVYPTEGKVIAPDWDSTPICGGGLHGLLWGEGNGNLLLWEPDAKWLVLEAKAKHVVDLVGKVKVPRATVVHCGDQQSATQYLLAHGAQGRPVVGASVRVGDYSTATVGYRGRAGAGHHSLAVVGYEGIATVSHYSRAVAGNQGTAIAGHRGTAQAGHHGTATAGNHGTATAGDYGKAQAGDQGTAQAGYQGKATAGYQGRIFIEWHDGERLRLAVGYIGEDNLLPGIPYELDDKGNFIPA